MGLQFDYRIREKLRQRRQEQLAEARAGRMQAAADVLVANEVVWVRCGWGNASYLGLDGSVIFWNYADGIGPQVLTDVESVACVVGWAAESGLPELLEFLPEMPLNGVTCRQCRGSRWMPKRARISRGGGPQVCLLCHGLGWTAAELEKEHAT